MVVSGRNRSVAPTIRASLVLRDFGNDPNVVTKAIGLEPTRKGRAGEASVSSSGRPISSTVKSTFWSLHSRLSPSSQISEHIADVAQQLGSASERLSRLPEGTTLTFRCTIIPEGDLPILAVDVSAAAVLAQMRARLELDVVSVDGPA